MDYSAAGNRAKGQYESDSWSYENVELGMRESQRVPESHAELARNFRAKRSKRMHTDETLQNPRCVFQILSGTSRATRRRWSRKFAA